MVTSILKTSSLLKFLPVKNMKFNQKTNNTTENLAGGQAYKESEKLEIVSLLLTSFCTDQFYRKGTDTIDKLAELIKNAEDKLFVAKAAIYARTKFGMRSISHVASAEIVKTVKGKEWTKDYLKQVMIRPDDITETFAYYLSKYGKPVPNSLKKGIARALDKFNGYQLAKYRSAKADVKMVDVVNLIHPTPSATNDEAIAALVRGDLKSTETWESKLTKAGQVAESEEEKEDLKNAAWKELLTERKLGYFALLRNLRNIIEQSPESIQMACDTLEDETLITKSLVLPFRFQTAADEIEKLNTADARKVLVSIQKALDISVKNVPKFEGETLIALDVSGSMSGRPAEIGALFAAILAKSNNADVLMFDTNATYKEYNPMDSVLTTAKKFKFNGGGTDFDSIFIGANKKYDRIVILSDMQSWSSYHTPKESFKEYKKKYGADPKIYSFDLQGYGTLQFPENNVYAITGFSEKVFDIMKLLETDRQALIHEIESIII